MFTDVISKCILQVRKECHFFGAMMLFANIVESRKIDTAATDGINIFVNKDFLLSLSSTQQNALMLHEVLHMALLHVTRRGSRDPKIWNIAADIVVNDLIIRNTPFRLPKDAIIDKSFRDCSVEFIYEALLKKNKHKTFSLSLMDILNPKDKDEESSNQPNCDLSQSEIESYWRDKIQVLQNSDINQPGKGQGNLPGGMETEISCVLEPEVDWRHALWKYVGKTPADFDDLDRRFIYKGLYLEGLLTEALEVSVCIDTSGSISNDLLDQFIGELKGILRSYPHVKCNLYFADTEIYGPYEIHSIEELPKAAGFGGTSFVPFFNYLEKEDSNNLLGQNKASIYLTDGYGDFPNYTPSNPTMWVVCSDGLSSNEFPFGEVIRISTESY